MGFAIGMDLSNFKRKFYETCRVWATCDQNDLTWLWNKFSRNRKYWTLVCSYLTISMNSHNFDSDFGTDPSLTFLLSKWTIETPKQRFRRRARSHDLRSKWIHIASKEKFTSHGELILFTVGINSHDFERKILENNWALLFCDQNGLSRL